MVIFTIVAYRSAVLSIVYDEAATLAIVSDTYQNIFSGIHNFASANNHILNTLLTKWCRDHISTAEWATRLPNVLSFILYYISLVGLAYIISDKLWPRVLLVLLCALDIYMLDFFSLCRGYGIANAFQMCALYFLVKDLKRGNTIILPFIFGGIAVLANFTWVIVLGTIGCTAGIYTYLHTVGNWKDRLFKVIQKCWPGLIVLVVLYFSVHNQIENLSKIDEFKWGANGWWDAQHTYVKNFLYTHQPPMFKFYVVQGLLVFIYLFAWRTYSIKKDRMLLIALLLISSVFAITILQRNILDIRYINERKATLYISLTALVIVALVQAWIEIRITKSLAFGLSLFMIIHIYRMLNPNIVLEWYYDAYTKKMMEIVAAKKPKTLGLHWLFHPSTRYYQSQMMPSDSLITYEKRYEHLPQGLDAYYLMPDDTIKLDGYDTIFKGVSGQIFLMKHGI